MQSYLNTQSVTIGVNNAQSATTTLNVSYIPSAGKSSALYGGKLPKDHGILNK